jgi:hypothetical protein
MGQLLDEAQAKEFEWTKAQRAHLANEIDTICVEVGRLAAQNQPDFEVDRPAKKANHITA